MSVDLLSYSLSKLASSLETEQMSFAEYFRAAWHIIEPTTELQHNWHIDCIAEHLDAVILGQIQFLVINLPPRKLKSALASCLWPTHAWTKRPGLKWIFLSYSQILTEQFSKNRRDVIENDWYQSRWGSIVKMSEDQNQKRKFMNTARGSMMATSIGGTLTGEGADIIVIDDGIDPQRANSKADRESAIRFVKSTVATRLNDKRTGAIVEISQRTHPQDISGTLLAEGIYTHLNLPATANKKVMITFPISKKEVVRDVGDVLDPIREPAEILARQKLQMTIEGKSMKAYEAQYQQDPKSDVGNMFPRSCWKYHNAVPRVLWRMWSWDTAMEEGEENDYTVGAYMVFHMTGVCIERIVRERLQYPELKRTVENEFNGFPADEIVIENKVSGMSLQQDLKRGTILPVIAYPRKVADGGQADVRGDKQFRASLASPWMESGRVSLREGAIWVPEFIEEFAGFPDGEFKDQVDTICQGINRYVQKFPKPAAVLVGGGISLPTSQNSNGNGKNGVTIPPSPFQRRPSWA